MKNIRIILLLFMPIIFSACSKAGEDMENPIVNITVENEVYTSGETVLFSIQATDNDGLHDIDLDIYKKIHLDTPAKSFNVHSHGKSVNRQFEWIPVVELQTDFVAILTASDHSGNVGRDTVMFSVFPSLAD